MNDHDERDAGAAADMLGSGIATVAGAAGGSQVGKEAATGAAIGASVGAVLEVVPVFGPLLHGIAAAAGAIGGAISGALRDKYHPSPLQAGICLLLCHIAPGMIYAGFDNITTKTSDAAVYAGRLVRYWRLVSGLVKFSGPLYNPCNSGYRSHNLPTDTLQKQPYIESKRADPQEPLTDIRLLGHIRHLVVRLHNQPAAPAIPPLVRTITDAQRILAALRGHLAKSGVLEWDEIKSNLRGLRIAIGKVMTLAGETRPDPVLSQLLRGAVRPHALGRRDHGPHALPAARHPARLAAPPDPLPTAPPAAHVEGSASDPFTQLRAPAADGRPSGSGSEPLAELGQARGESAAPVLGLDGGLSWSLQPDPLEEISDPFAELDAGDIEGQEASGADPLTEGFAVVSTMHRMIEAGERGDPQTLLRAAKDALRAELGRPPWLRGVGIGLDHHGSNLLVQVSALTPEVRAVVPATFMAPGSTTPIPVRLEMVGDAVAQHLALAERDTRTERARERAAALLLHLVNREDLHLAGEDVGAAGLGRGRLYAPPAHQREDSGHREPGREPRAQAVVPGLVLVHGVTPQGIDNPRLVQLAKALAASGLTVLTPEIPELAGGRLDPGAVDSIAQAVIALADRIGAPVGLVGLSIAGGLSLLAAAEPRCADRLNFVCAIGAHHDLGRVARFCLTNHVERIDQGWHHLNADPAGRRMVAEILVDDANERPGDRVEARKALAALSPAGRLGGLSVPVYLLHGAEDNLIPAAEAEWIARELPVGLLRRQLVTPALSHVDVGAVGDVAADEATALVEFLADLLAHAETTAAPFTDPEDPHQEETMYDASDPFQALPAGAASAEAGTVFDDAAARANQAVEEARAYLSETWLGKALGIEPEPKLPRTADPGFELYSAGQPPALRRDGDAGAPDDADAGGLLDFILDPDAREAERLRQREVLKGIPWVKDGALGKFFNLDDPPPRPPPPPPAPRPRPLVLVPEAAGEAGAPPNSMDADAVRNAILAAPPRAVPPAWKVLDKPAQLYWWDPFGETWARMGDGRDREVAKVLAVFWLKETHFPVSYCLLHSSEGSEVIRAEKNASQDPPAGEGSTAEWRLDNAGASHLWIPAYTFYARSFPPGETVRFDFAGAAGGAKEAGAPAGWEPTYLPEAGAPIGVAPETALDGGLRTATDEHPTFMPPGEASGLPTREDANGKKDYYMLRRLAWRRLLAWLAEHPIPEAAPFVAIWKRFETDWEAGDERPYGLEAQWENFFKASELAAARGYMEGIGLNEDAPREGGRRLAFVRPDGEAAAPIGAAPETAIEQLLIQLDHRYPYRGKGSLDGVQDGVLRITDDPGRNGPRRTGPDLADLGRVVSADARILKTQRMSDPDGIKYLAIIARPVSAGDTSAWDLSGLSAHSETGASGEETGYPARPSLAALRKLEDQLDAAWPARRKKTGGNISDASIERDRGKLEVPESPPGCGPAFADVQAAVKRDARVVETEIVTPSFWNAVRVPTLRIFTAERGIDASPWDLSAPATGLLGEASGLDTGTPRWQHTMSQMAGAHAGPTYHSPMVAEIAVGTPVRVVRRAVDELGDEWASIEWAPGFRRRGDGWVRASLLGGYDTAGEAGEVADEAGRLPELTDERLLEAAPRVLAWLGDVAGATKLLRAVQGTGPATGLNRLQQAILDAINGTARDEAAGMITELYALLGRDRGSAAVINALRGLPPGKALTRFGRRVLATLTGEADTTSSALRLTPTTDDAGAPETGAVARTYTAAGGETPQTIASRYGALSRESWAAELKDANPQRNWVARIYSGDVISIPGEWSLAPEETGAPRWQEAMAQTSLVYARPSYHGDVLGEVLGDIPVNTLKRVEGWSLIAFEREHNGWVPTHRIGGYEVDDEPAEGEVTLEDFEEPLSRYGTWIDDPRFGRIWQPADDVAGADFAPYASDGSWVANEDGGWVFQSKWDSEFGWATYHYGRWVDHPELGWVWTPGTEWAPSWVEWRHGGGYVGFVPMGPEGYISPEHRWVFVEERRFADPGGVWRYRVPRERLHTVYFSAVPIVRRAGVRWSYGPPVERIRAAGGVVRQLRIAMPTRAAVRELASVAVQRAIATARPTPAAGGGAVAWVRRGPTTGTTIAVAARPPAPSPVHAPPPAYSAAHPAASSPPGAPAHVAAPAPPAHPLTLAQSPATPAAAAASHVGVQRHPLTLAETPPPAAAETPHGASPTAAAPHAANAAPPPPPPAPKVAPVAPPSAKPRPGKGKDVGEAGAAPLELAPTDAGDPFPA